MTCKHSGHRAVANLPADVSLNPTLTNIETFLVHPPLSWQMHYYLEPPTFLFSPPASSWCRHRCIGPSSPTRGPLAPGGTEGYVPKQSERYREREHHECPSISCSCLVFSSLCAPIPSLPLSTPLPVHHDWSDFTLGHSSSIPRTP